MKNNTSAIFITISFIIGLVATGNCDAAGDRRSGKKDKTADEQLQIEQTYLDTLNQGQELSLTDKKMPPSDVKEEKVKVEKSDVEEIKNKVDGFRIQLMASTDIEKLRAKKDAIESELNLKIYIEHDEPYYKVYAGDFTKRGKADKALVKVKESGYPDAWIVRTKVIVND